MTLKDTIAKNSRSGLIFLILTFGAIAVFSKVLFLNASLFGSDFVLYFYPVKHFIRHSVSARGALPFWNPFQFSGSPFIANIQAAMFYPPGFLFYLMPAEHAYLWTVIFHCFLGSAFMYAFVRDLGVNRAGALLSALVFMYNGYFMAHLYAGHLTLVQSYIWLPLILLFVRRFFKTKQFFWTFLASLFLGIQILGGFPQIAFYTILAILGFGLFCIGSTFKDSRQDAFSGLLGLILILGVGFSLAAIQLLPTLGLTSLSGRAGGVDYAFATMDSLHPKMLFSFLVPDIFGNAVDHTFYLTPKSWHFWETCGYVGLLPLVLVFIAPPRTSALRQIRWFFLALALGALCLAFGKYNPIYPMIFKLPGFHHFRIPAQILYLFVFAVAVMSGIGIHHAKDSERSASRPLAICLLGAGVVVIFLLAAMIYEPYGFFIRLFRLVAQEPVGTALVSRLPAKLAMVFGRSAIMFFFSALIVLLLQKKKTSIRAFEIAVVLVTMIDLGCYAFGFVKPYDFSVPQKKQTLVQTLQGATSSGRAMATSPAWDFNDGTLYRFCSIDGYDPLVLSRIMTYLQASQGLPPDRQVITTGFLKNHDAKLLELLNLKYLVGNGRLIKASSALPRAFLVEKAIYVPASQVLDTMAREGFDPWSTVVFESEQPRFQSPLDGQVRSQGDCVITNYDYESITLTASCTRPCYLVLSEIYYPGWRAKVDGIEVPVLRGDYLFRVVPLTQGNHEIVMHFVSVPFRIGAAISLITLLGCGVSLWLIQRRSRRVTRRNT